MSINFVTSLFLLERNYLPYFTISQLKYSEIVKRDTSRTSKQRGNKGYLTTLTVFYGDCFMGDDPDSVVGLTRDCARPVVRALPNW